MLDLIKKGALFSLGLAVASKEQVEKVVDELVQKGTVNKEQSKEVINYLIEKGEVHQDELNAALRKQIKQVVTELNLATKDDLARLELEIRELRKKQIRSSHLE